MNPSRLWFLKKKVACLMAFLRGVGIAFADFERMATNRDGTET